MFRPLTRTQLTVDIVVAALFGLCSFAATIAGWGMVGSRVLAEGLDLVAATLLTIVFSAALALRRRSPVWALAVAWGAAIVQMALTLPPLPANVAIFGILYATAVYGTTRVFWIGFVSALVGAGAISIYLITLPILMNGSTQSALSLGATVVFATAATFAAASFALLLSWTAGALVRASIRARDNRIAQELAEAAAAAESERTRIARDMHDVVAHSLAVVIAQADGARYAAAADPAVASTALGTISATARSALSDVRMLLTQLRHTQADGPQPTLAELEQLYARVRAAGVELLVDVSPMPPPDVPAAVQLAVYRILQEALTNALRHGAAGAVVLRIAWHPGRVELIVQNPTASPGTPPAPESARGHGLIGMRERAQLVGGTVDAGPAGGVFVVRAVLPVVGTGEAVHA
ncbi:MULTISPECIES: sensor histidine kinase [unclassified Microbacterium]|uniref:sensor histidine kinase n=1 Tax=unclassified Microbacterium TaxID=2609290 RepID=UPI003018E216